jgi:hypothetical protein
MMTQKDWEWWPEKAHKGRSFRPAKPAQPTTAGASPRFYTPYETPKAPQTRRAKRRQKLARMMKRGMEPQPLESFPPRIQELLEMLGMRRPSGGTAVEWAYGTRWVGSLGAEPDAVGNWWLELPHADGSRSPILWSSHLDTVHRVHGEQRLLACREWVGTHSPASNCLGADDTTGVWMMRQMALAGIPGTYIWHTGEESGGVGSRWIEKESRERLAHLRYAIAFDRAGYSDIITHQCADRCCSDAFAQSVAAILAPLEMKPSSHGVFTDTANYTSVIAECTNLSVGYHGQHTEMEWQNLIFAEQLLEAVLAADWSQLVESRKPGETEQGNWRWNSAHYYGGKYGRRGGGGSSATGSTPSSIDTEYSAWWDEQFEDDVEGWKGGQQAPSTPPALLPAPTAPDEDILEQMAEVFGSEEGGEGSKSAQAPGLQIEVEPHDGLRVSADVAARRLLFGEIQESPNAGGRVAMQALVEMAGMEMHPHPAIEGAWQIVEMSGATGEEPRTWRYDEESSPWFPLLSLGFVIFEPEHPVAY